MLLSSEGWLEAFVEGAVTQVAVLGEHLTPTRRISIAYGSGVVTVDDEVINHGYASSPLAMMYDVNFGWPVVVPGAIVKTPPRRLRAEGDNGLVREPAPGTAERLWIFAVRRDEHGRGSVGIANARVDAARHGRVVDLGRVGVAEARTMGDSQRRGPLRRWDRAFNRASWLWCKRWRSSQVEA